MLVFGCDPEPFAGGNGRRELLPHIQRQLGACNQQPQLAHGKLGAADRLARGSAATQIEALVHGHRDFGALQPAQLPPAEEILNLHAEFGIVAEPRLAKPSPRCGHIRLSGGDGGRPRLCF